MKSNYYRLREAQAINLEAADQLTLFTHSPTLFVLTEGSGSFRVDDMVCDLSYGCLLIAHSGTKVEFSCHDSFGMHMYRIQFEAFKLVEENEGRLLHRMTNEGLPDSGLISTHCSYHVIALFKAILDLTQESERISDPFIEQRLLLELLQEVLITIKSTPYSLQEFPIQKVLNFVRDNYGSALERSELARMVGYHPHSLSKKFKKETGLSLSDYILQVRMEKAKDKLLITASPVNEIAASVGYSDALYFSRKFKRATEMSPTEYRLKPKRIIAFDFAGTLLLLGLKPVGIEMRLRQYSQLLDEDLAGMVCFEAWDMDSIRLLQPDVIVAPTYLRPEHLQQLSAIAPVISQSCEQASPIEIVHNLGQLLGRQQEAENWFKEFKILVQRLTHKLMQIWSPEESIAVYEIAAGNVYVMDLYDRCSYAVYQIFGLRPPNSVQQDILDKRKFKLIGPQQLQAYAADHMVVSIYEKEDMEQTQRLLNSEFWRQLPAVRNDRVYWIPMNQCWYNDGLSLQRMLVLLTELLCTRCVRQQ